MKFCKPFLLFILVALKAASQENITTSIALTEKKGFANKYLTGKQSLASGNFTVHYYRCEWNIDPAVRYICGSVTAYFTVTQQASQLVFDLTDSLRVDSVRIHNMRVPFEQKNDETLTLQLPGIYATGSDDSVCVYYKGTPPVNANNSFVKSEHNGVPVIWTLSEPYGAKDWWPCRNGLDDKADSIDIYVTHPAAYKTSSIGLLQSEVTTGGFTTSFYKHRYPVASYLVAIAVTNYSVFTRKLQLGNVMLPVISYVYPEDLDYFEARTPYMLQAMQLFYNVYGEYPFSKERYGQTQFGFGGGMEHQTNSFVVNGDENLMAHELAHQWFGDKITCASWRDIWLNEGFATYSADFLYMKEFSPYYYPLYVEGDLGAIVSEPGGQVWVEDTSSIDRIFNGRLSYAKGAFLLRMLQWTLGDSIFFKAVRQYQDDVKIKYGFATTADLKRNVEEVSGKDLTYFFDQWLYGQGYPTFTVQWSQNLNSFVELKVSEATSHPSVSFFKVPLQLILKNATQEKKIVVECTENNKTFAVPAGFIVDTILIDSEHFLISKDNKAVHVPASTVVNDLNVYPNPFSDKLIISLRNPSAAKMQVQLYNVQGQKLWQKEYSLTGQDETITITSYADLPRGVYFLKVYTLNNKPVIKKLVK